MSLAQKERDEIEANMRRVFESRQYRPLVHVVFERDVRAWGRKRGDVWQVTPGDAQALIARGDARAVSGAAAVALVRANAERRAGPAAAESRGRPGQPVAARPSTPTREESDAAGSFSRAEWAKNR